MLALAFLGWLFACTILMSLAEYAIHRWLMHKPTLVRLFDYVPVLRKVYYQHAHLHHGKYYKQFDHEEDPVGRDLDITLDLHIDLLLALPFMAALYFISPMAPLALAVVVASHATLWSIIHSEMHRPRHTWFAKTRPYLYLARYHWLHHRYVGRNFNVVLPMFDSIFGTRAKATPQDLQAMNRLGLL